MTFFFLFPSLVFESIMQNEYFILRKITEMKLPTHYYKIQTSPLCSHWNEVLNKIEYKIPTEDDSVVAESNFEYYNM